MTLLAVQVYMPTSDDCAFLIVSELTTEHSFTEVDMLYLQSSDASSQLTFQLMAGTGSPMASHLNVIGYD